MNRPKLKLTIEVPFDAPFSGDTIDEKAEKLIDEVRRVLPSAEMMGAKVEATTLWEKNEASDSDDTLRLIDTAFLRLVAISEMIGVNPSDVRRGMAEVPHLASHSTKPEPAESHVVRVGRLMLYRSVFNGVRVWVVSGQRRDVEPGTHGGDAFLSAQVQVCRETEFKSILSLLLNALSSDQINSRFSAQVDETQYLLKLAEDSLPAQSEDYQGFTNGGEKSGPKQPQAVDGREGTAYTSPTSQGNEARN